MERREFFSAAAGLAAPAVLASDGDDEAAIRQIVQRYVEAREARNSDVIESLLTPDADQLVSDGTWRRGRDELVKGMLESSKKNPAKRTITVETIRRLTPDIALVDGHYVQKAKDMGGNREMWTAITLKKAEGAWRIAAIRNMLPTGHPKPVPTNTDPHPCTVLEEALDLAQKGKYEEALQKHIWFHENALRITPGMVGVRLSFALGFWVELGKAYPKARSTLAAIRDKDIETMKSQSASAGVFNDVQSISNYLEESPKTIETFKYIDIHKPTLANQCYFYAEEVLAKAGEYALCSKYIPNPELDLQRYKSLYLLSLKHENELPEGSTIPKLAGPSFVKNTCRLIEILIGAGRRTEAEKIQEEALEFYNDRRIREAVNNTETANNKSI